MEQIDVTQKKHRQFFRALTMACCGHLLLNVVSVAVGSVRCVMTVALDDVNSNNEKQLRLSAGESAAVELARMAKDHQVQSSLQALFNISARALVEDEQS